MEYSTNGVLASIFILFIIIVVMRHVALWYWKVNTIVTSQKKQEILLQLLLYQLGAKNIKVRIRNIKSKDEADVGIDSATELLLNNSNYKVIGLSESQN